MTPTNPPRDAHHYTDEEMHNEAVAHEHSDANIRTLLGFGGALLAVVAITAVLMYGLFVVFEKQAEARDPRVTPLAAPAGQAPRGPRLLTNEPANLRQFRQEEQGKLDTYGWMNQRDGIVHVPIDDAKKLVVQHGLPARAGVADDQTQGTHAPAYGESSGGRTIPVKQAAPTAPAGQEIKK